MMMHGHLENCICNDYENTTITQMFEHVKSLLESLGQQRYMDTHQFKNGECLFFLFAFINYNTSLQKGNNIQ